MATGSFQSPITRAGAAPIVAAPAGGGFNDLLQQLGLGGALKGATGYAEEMLAGGSPSADAARNANAMFGLRVGQPAAGPVGDFITNRGADLYGEQRRGNRAQGFNDILGLFQGTVNPALGFRGQDISQAQGQGQLGLGYAQLGAQSSQAAQDLALRKLIAGQQYDLGQGQLGISALNTGNNYLNSYLNFLQ